MNNVELINQTLREHLQSNIEYFGDNISTPQTYFFLSMLFLQSVGFMEQKISCIVWEIGYREHLERYKIFKDYRMESIGYNELSMLYKKLNKSNALKLENENNILDNIKEIIKSSSSLFEELEYNFFVLENEIPKKDLNSLITDLREQRNFIAHFKSFYPDKSIISFCAKNENNKNIRFEGFLFYLAVLIKLDEMFIEAFKSYEND
ncbi:hypothetical protein [Helicobacter apodemus]|uniref:RiboL-PSP-HEPN domain-containing protein n=1 Tax=Helicobacter apodemus TaxID=135569 RepID=A0A2U8FE40_9HELI|nr:hypothetical protein [Helicobacter apodemus]AWI34097.1 hypothetical protein CDV25_04405 [Helicobacter apodemus]